MTEAIMKSVDGITFRLADDTREAAEQARITLADLASALGYADKSKLKQLADRHAQELAEFGISATVAVLSHRGQGAIVKVQEPTYNPDQAAYLALSSETPQGRACRVRILKAYKSLLAAYEAATQALTPIQMLVVQAQALADLEQRQLAQAKEVEAQNARIALLEAHVQPEPEYYTVLAWSRICGLSPTWAQATQLGRDCARKSRAEGYEVGRARDPRYGSVGQYHVDVLRSVVGDERH